MASNVTSNASRQPYRCDAEEEHWEEDVVVITNKEEGKLSGNL